MKAKIFNELDVEAIIAGKKTMFREVIKNAIYDPPVHSYKDWLGDGWYYPIATMFDKNNKEKETQYTSKAVKPKFQVGQEIKPTNSSIHLQLKLFNTNLRIKSVKVERLQDISANDALGEGVSESEFWKPKEINEPDDYRFWQTYPQIAFRNFWNSTQKKQEHKWEANPWVFAYEFEVINLKK